MSDDKPRRLPPRCISAGTDPDTGAPTLRLDAAAAGFDAPDQRYLLTPDGARKVGAQLLLAADPDLAAALLVNERRGLGQVLARGAGARTLEPEVVANLNAGLQRFIDPDRTVDLQPGSIADPEAYERAKADGTIRELPAVDLHGVLDIIRSRIEAKRKEASRQFGTRQGHFMDEQVSALQEVLDEIELALRKPGASS